MDKNTLVYWIKINDKVEKSLFIVPVTSSIVPELRGNTKILYNKMFFNTDFFMFKSLFISLSFIHLFFEL